MGATRLEHVNMRTASYEETKDFYVDVVGLRVGPRPDFEAPGYWLYAGDLAVIHISGQLGGWGSGAINHVSFRATGLPAMLAIFAQRGIPYESADVPGTGERQIFLQDPNGVTVELTFSADQVG